MWYYRDSQGNKQEISMKVSDTLPIGAIVEYTGSDTPKGWINIGNNKIEKTDYSITSGAILANSYGISINDGYTQSYINTLAQQLIPVGTVAIYAGSVAPEGYLICDGSEVPKSEYLALFNVIGTTFGTSSDSTKFKLPNLQGRIPVGLNSNDTTFNSVGVTGGSKNILYTPHGSNSEVSVNEHTYTPQGNNTGTAVTAHTYTPAGTNSEGAVQNTTLSVSQIPQHSHGQNIIGEDDTVNGWVTSGSGDFGGVYFRGQHGYYGSGHARVTTDSVGGGGSHTHDFTQPKFEGTQATLSHTVTQPTFTGTQATLSHTVTQPTFTGEQENINIIQPYIVMNYIIKY